MKPVPSHKYSLFFEDLKEYQSSTFYVQEHTSTPQKLSVERSQLAKAEYSTRMSVTRITKKDAVRKSLK